MCINWRLVHVRLGWEDHYSIPARGDLDWLLLLNPVDRKLVLGVRPEDPERCTANVPRYPGVIKTYMSAVD